MKLDSQGRPWNFQRMETGKLRRMQALRLHRLGTPVVEIAATLGVSRKSVYEYIKQAPEQKEAA